jgi:hypothetical protein
MLALSFDRIVDGADADRFADLRATLQEFPEELV